MSSLIHNFLVPLGQIFLYISVCYSAYLMFKYKTLCFWFDAGKRELLFLRYILLSLFALVLLSIVIAVGNNIMS